MHLQGKTIGYFVAPEVEDLEYWMPVMRLREEGARVITIGLSKQTVRGKHGLEQLIAMSSKRRGKLEPIS